MLSRILIMMGLATYTVALLIFLEMPANYRIILCIGESLMCIGISISSMNERKK